MLGCTFWGFEGRLSEGRFFELKSGRFFSSKLCRLSEGLNLGQLSKRFWGPQTTQTLRTSNINQRALQKPETLLVFLVSVVSSYLCEETPETRNKNFGFLVLYRSEHAIARRCAFQKPSVI